MPKAIFERVVHLDIRTYAYYGGSYGSVEYCNLVAEPSISISMLDSMAYSFLGAVSE